MKSHTHTHIFPNLKSTIYIAYRNATSGYLEIRLIKRQFVKKFSHALRLVGGV